MRSALRKPGIGPKDIIRWQGARQVLDHVRQRSGRGVFALAINLNKGTRP